MKRKIFRNFGGSSCPQEDAKAIEVANMALAADHSSNSDEPGEFDIEPPILKQNLSNEQLSSEAEVARLEKQFQLAKQIAASAARFYKIGVLSKAEMEQRLD